MFTASADTSQLDRKIREMAAATGRTVEDVARQQMKLLVRDVMAITPPGSAGVSGRAALKAGENAIDRDLGRMGFKPVALKGFRTITHVPAGHVKGEVVSIAAVRVKTRENPRFADPDAFHASCLLSRHGRKVTRGGRQGFYVDQRKFKLMRARLFAQIGRLAAGWIPAADALGVAVPAWIRRHAGSARGTFSVSNSASRITIEAVNQFPDTASELAAATRRRINFAIAKRLTNITAQLQRAIAGNWKNS